MKAQCWRGSEDDVRETGRNQAGENLGCQAKGFGLLLKAMRTWSSKWGAFRMSLLGAVESADWMGASMAAAGTQVANAAVLFWAHHECLCEASKHGEDESGSEKRARSRRFGVCAMIRGMGRSWGWHPGCITVALVIMTMDYRRQRGDGLSKLSCSVDNWTCMDLSPPTLYCPSTVSCLSELASSTRPLLNIRPKGSYLYSRFQPISTYNSLNENYTRGGGPSSLSN